MSWLRCLLLCTGLACATAAEERPLLAPVHTDHAVLQRDRPIAVWGWTTPGGQVAVELAGAPGAAPVTATAGADGRWQAALGPYPAGGPYVLRASGGGRSAEARDVLVGEVWLCSGQSNMEMLVKNAADPEGEQKAAAGDQVRHLRVERARSAEPQTQMRGAWKPALPGNVPEFSAVAYFLGRELHRQLRVPIGVVNSSWGGTGLQYWTSAEGLSAVPGEAQNVTRFQEQARLYAAQLAANGGKDYPELSAAWFTANDPGTAATPAWSADGLDDSTWTEVAMPDLLPRLKAVPAGFKGTVWLRRGLVLPEAAAGKGAFLRLGRVNDIDATWVNGRLVGENEHASAGRGYQIPDHLLRPGGNVIAMRILCRGGNPGFTTRPDEMSLSIQGLAGPLPLAGAWRMHPGIELRQAPPYPLNFDHFGGLTTLYNGMIAPLTPLSLAGVAWYQGESNTSNGYRYRSLLAGLVADWRGRFAQERLPFLIVSLANHRERAEKPGDSAWAELREAQALTAQRVPACGLAVAIDVGDARDIHPKDKQTVGRRLALAARAVAYGEQIAWSGPWYRDQAVEGAAIRLRFDHLGGGLAAAGGGALTGFAIAGEDRAFVWAEARIDGDCVLVSSPAVPRPVAVRYAWADNPACNLVNLAGLPAVPFRTDDWPITSSPKP